jgi:hypothetical protein
MNHHPDEQRTTTNELFIRARRLLPSPTESSQVLTRAQLANAVNSALDISSLGGVDATRYVDAGWISRIERGQLRWPTSERRSALRLVLGVENDAEIGLDQHPRPGNGS